MVQKSILTLLGILFLLPTTAQKPQDSIALAKFYKSFDSIEKTYYKVRNLNNSKQYDVYYTKLQMLKNQHCSKTTVNCTEINEYIAKKMLNRIEIRFYSPVQPDSILHYHKKIQTLTKNHRFLAISFSYAGIANQAKRDYNAFLQNAYKSINHYKQSDYKQGFLRGIGIYIDIIDVYLRLDNVYFAKKTLDNVAQELENNKNDPYYTIAQLVYNRKLANYYNKTGAHQKALTVIEKIDTSAIKQPRLLFNYFVDYLHILLANKMYEKGADIYKTLFIDEKYKSPNTAFVYNKIQLSMALYLATKEETYLSAIANYVDDDNPEILNFNLELNKLYSTYHQSKGNFKKAYAYLKKYQKEKDSIATYNTQVANEVMLFNLRKESEVTQLEMQKLADENDFKQKEKNYILFVSITLFFLVVMVLLIVWFKERKNLKTKLTLEKNLKIIALKNNFLQNIAHEIQTPITVINGYTSLLKESLAQPDTILNYTKRIENNTQSLLYLLSNMLLSSKENKNAIEQLNKTSMVMATFCENTIENFATSCAIKNISLYFKTNIRNNVTIEFYYAQLTIIINNLMNNAIKFTNANSAIYTSFLIEVTANKLTIVVKDEGIGIPENEQESIFDRFYQSEKSVVNGGFGVGLSLVKDLVTQMKGTITLKSQPNVGSIFTVHIPLFTDHTALYTLDSKVSFKQISTNKTKKIISKKVPKALFIDDNTAIIGYYKDVFKDKLAVTVAFNGQQAFELLEKQTFDIIVADYRMPFLDGISLKKKIDSLPDVKSIPFIIVTADTNIYNNLVTQYYGTVDVLTKPFDKNELLVRIQNLLKRNVNIKNFKTLTNDEKIKLEQDYSKLIKKVNLLINEHLLDTSYDLKKLAKECGYNSRKLNDIIQLATGLSFTLLVLEIRLQRTYELIIYKQNTTLNEIMYSAGFNTRSYFYKKFEERFGIKPGELKKKYK